MSRTVYLHVGIAKTGTTYLQRTLFANRDLLRQHGTLYPGPDAASHFLGSLDLRGAKFKGHTYERAEGAWARLVSQANDYEGNTLISHETLAHAKPEHIDQAVHDFTTEDVRVVVTARDLARQLPAAWQESLKNRGETEYDDFLAGVFAGWHAEVGGEGRFWGAQDVRGVVARWGGRVGLDNVTVVTVPPSGSERSILWERFRDATALPEIHYAFPERDNSSLGVAEAELLRRLNPRLRDELDWPRYDGLIKKRLAEGVLGPLEAQGRLRLPQRWRDDTLAISAAAVEYLALSGVRIVGDLEDLEPSQGFDDGSGRQPSELSDREVLDAALDVIAVLAVRPPGPPQANAGVAGAVPSRMVALARKVRAWLPRPLRDRLHRR